MGQPALLPRAIAPLDAQAKGGIWLEGAHSGAAMESHGQGQVPGRRVQGSLLLGNALDCILEGLASSEGRGLALRNVKGLASAWVSPLASSPHSSLKCPKPGDANLLTFSYILYDGVQDDVHCCLSLLLGDERLFGNFFYQLAFVHASPGIQRMPANNCCPLRGNKQLLTGKRGGEFHER